MENKKIELKEQLDKTIKQLKTQCKDQRYADNLIEQLLLLKGQLSVKPVEVCVESDTVIFRNNYGSYELIKTDNEIIYASMGYRIIVKPYAMEADGVQGSSLYHWLDAVLAMQEKKQNLKDGENLTQDEESILENMLFALDSICQIPLLGFLTPDCMTELVGVIHKHIAIKFEEAEKGQLPKDNDAANHSFEQEVLSAESMAEELKKEEEVKDGK